MGFRGILVIFWVLSIFGDFRDIRGILVILEVSWYFANFRDFGDNFGCPRVYW